MLNIKEITLKMMQSDITNKNMLDVKNNLLKGVFQKAPSISKIINILQ